MNVYHNTVINTNGNAVSGATVTVRVAADPPASGALANIYSDDGVTLIVGSQVTTDSAGRFKFWAPDGKYDLTVSGPGITTFTLQDVEIADVTERFSTDAVHTANIYNAGTGIRINGAATSGNVLRGDGTNFVSATLAVTDLSTFSSADLRGRLTDETGSGAAVFGTSPTLVTPTIGSFANAAHNHQDAAGGGTLAAAAVASGTFDNARINWASPNAIGTGTPAAGTFTTVTGNTSVSSPVFLQGATPASNGGVRLSNNSGILARNAAGTGDVLAFTVNGSDELSIGAGGGTAPTAITVGVNGLPINLFGNLVLRSVAFASLGTPSNGTALYCSDCTKATPCASGGTGAFAKRINGAWDCD